LKFDTLPQQLGFEETPELQQIRRHVIETVLLRNETDVEKALQLYNNQAQAHIDSQGKATATDARNGLAVQIALLYWQAGARAECREQLTQQLAGAQGDLVRCLQDLLNYSAEAEATSAEIAYACREVLSEYDVFFIFQMPLAARPYQHACSQLEARGVRNPIEFLRQQGIRS
jgi:hypothetical protein